MSYIKRIFLRLLYEYLEIEQTITWEEAERIHRDAASPGVAVPGADGVLDFINRHGTRSAVVSNNAQTSQTLRERI